MTMTPMMMGIIHNSRRMVYFSMVATSTENTQAKKEGIDGKELYLKLKEKGILVRHFESERICDYLRITIGKLSDMKILVKTLGEILEEMK